MYTAKQDSFENYICKRNKRHFDFEIIYWKFQNVFLSNNNLCFLTTKIMYHTIIDPLFMSVLACSTLKEQLQSLSYSANSALPSAASAPKTAALPS